MAMFSRMFRHRDLVADKKDESAVRMQDVSEEDDFKAKTEAAEEKSEAVEEDLKASKDDENKEQTPNTSF
jgi:hypothetical protein